MAAWVIDSPLYNGVNIGAGDSLNVTATGAIWGYQQDGVTAGGGNYVVINGIVGARGTGTTGLRFNSGSDHLTIGAAAYVTGDAAGINILGSSNSIENSGEISASAGDAITIGGSSNILTLYASSHVQAQSNGINLTGGSNSIANIGSIYGAADEAVLLGAGGNIIFNGGTISGGTSGIEIGAGAMNVIVNSGTIRSAASDLTSAGLLSLSAVNLTNHGTIESGGRAIDLIQAGPSSIVNDGYILSGVVSLGAGNDTVVNNGLIEGQVQLGGGDDFYDGRNAMPPFADVYGDIGNDIIFGGLAPDHLWGGAGDDQLMGGPGPDTLLGDTGYDFARFDLASSAVTVWGIYQVGHLGPFIEWRNTGEALGDNYTSIEGFIGSNFDDTFVVLDDAETIMGLGGNDTLFGQGGADLIVGGSGGDWIRGGLGGDLFQYGLGDQGDLIMNFNEGGVRDGIDLRPLFDAAGYTGTNPRGDGIMQVLQNGADTDVYIYGTFYFRIQGVVAAAIDDTYFLFQ